MTLWVPLAGGPAGAAEEAPWWCARGAHLSATTLPGVLPLSVCDLTGRVVHTARGLGVQVPEVGYGVALSALATDGDDDLYVWTDEYAVHLDGGEYAAAFGYLDAIAAHAVTGSGDEGELHRMALAVRRVATSSVDRVRPPVVPTSRLLDAVDTLVAGADGAGVVGAVATLRTHLGVAYERDDSPDLAELRSLADAARDTLAAGTMDLPTAERLLTDAVVLRNYASGELNSPAAPAAVGASVPVLGELVGELSALIADGGSPPPDFWAATESWEAALADLSDHLARELGPYAPPVSVPVPTLPALGDETGLLSAGSPPPCSDGARSPYFPDRSHWVRGKTIEWYYNHGGHYSGAGYTVEGYLKPLTEGFDNMTKLNDDCGYSWRPNIKNLYLGQATRTFPQPPRLDGTCQQFTDGKNIVGWEDLTGTKFLALACAYRNTVGEVDGFDIAIANNVRWSIPEFDYCDRYAPEWDLEAVMTHEFGHALALGHVSEANHGNLTMSAANNGPCTRSERTPGYGDAIGLAVLYGRA